VHHLFIHSLALSFIGFFFYKRKFENKKFISNFTNYF